LDNKKTDVLSPMCSEPIDGCRLTGKRRNGLDSEVGCYWFEA